MDKILSCPVCGSPGKVCETRINWRVECRRTFDCAVKGPVRDTATEAVLAWNRMSSKLKNSSVGLKISDPPEDNKKYELPKTNIRHIVYHDGKYICMREDEWNNVRDKLLAWKALLILADKNDKEVEGDLSVIFEGL